MKNVGPAIAISIALLGACSSDKTEDAKAAAKEHFMSAQQKLYEQAQDVQDKATDALEAQKKALEEAASK